MTGTDSLDAYLILASRFENIEVAERTLLDLVSQVGSSGDEEYWLVTALREALANAILHGNRQDSSRVVRVAFAINQQTLTIRVEDEGEGFNPADVPDPTDPENLLRPSGRGIFYMKQFMDSVDFETTQAGGTAVTMVRRLQPSARSAEDEKSSP
jgi:serine/threonine-protein kinase RsbW